MKRSPNAFSLIELLVALAVLSIVAAIVVPNYIGLQTQAKDIAAKAMADNLNSTYANWIAAGGQSASGAKTSDILNTLTSSGAVNSAQNPWSFDMGNSNAIRLALASLGAAAQQDVVLVNDNIALKYDPSTGQFSAVILPSNGGAALLNGTIVAKDPATGNLIFAATPSVAGQVVKFGTNQLAVVDPATGTPVTVPMSSAIVPQIPPGYSFIDGTTSSSASPPSAGAIRDTTPLPGFSDSGKIFSYLNGVFKQTGRYGKSSYGGNYTIFNYNFDASGNYQYIGGFGNGM
jgi:prepilin-type N-terminal cleavage/methylation domain-containing protein